MQLSVYRKQLLAAEQRAAYFSHVRHNAAALAPRARKIQVSGCKDSLPWYANYSNRVGSVCLVCGVME